MSLVVPSAKSVANLVCLHCQRRSYGMLSKTSSTIHRLLTFGSTHSQNNANHSRIQRPDSSRPELWYTSYPISLVGKRQSPINIATKECLVNNRDLRLKPLIIEYPMNFKGLVLKNPRDDKFYGWRVDVFSKEARISGGPLDHNYRLAQFHCHWGKTCSCGSEHTIDGTYYSAELHLVHWNHSLYSSPHEALISPNGLTVLAVFLQAGDQPNEELTKLCDLMSKIKYKGDKLVMDKPINLAALLPQDKAYWTYPGSLTTPPLWETVTWIVFKKPVQCTDEQIQAFRQLSYRRRCETNGNEDKKDCDITIEENYRIQQPLNERQIIYVD